jgi:signal peptidase I
VKRQRKVGLVVLLSLLLAGCNGSYSSGDRVLVNKYIYDSGLQDPRRYDVVVFRCPLSQNEGPLDNFIKRLLGLAGETLAIFFGQLYVTTDIHYPEDLSPQDRHLGADKAEPLDLWQPKYMYPYDPKGPIPENRRYFHEDVTNLANPQSKDLFTLGQFTVTTPDGKTVIRRPEKGFQILRKPPETMLAMRRIVYDNDHQAKDLKGVLPPRWQAPDRASAWAADGDDGFKAAGDGKAGVDWLRYQHILRPPDWPSDPTDLPATRDDRIASIRERDHKPQLVTDFMGYNSYWPRHSADSNGRNWVGDLLLEFDLTVDRAEGELWVELARGVDRFHARWDLASGKCTLVRLQDGQPEQVLKSTDTALRQAGTYQVRVANFDQRLTVWVDRALPFGDGVDYPRAWSFDKAKGTFVNTGPTANDLKPASIAGKGAAVKVHHLKLYRNTYYTLGRPSGDADTPASPDFWSNPKEWDKLRQLDFLTLYVQPGHYLCLGDNSPESWDGRSWGTVPQRLMLGRALTVYYPFGRAGLIK